MKTDHSKRSKVLDVFSLRKNKSFKIKPNSKTKPKILLKNKIKSFKNQ